MQPSAANIARIDPAQCRLPPNRLPITRDDVEHLAASIKAHGQLVPGLVRRTPPGDPIRYEIICGARRHFTIAELGSTLPKNAQPFYAAIRPLSDEAAFAATTEILDNLCEAGKGCNDATFSTIATSDLSHAHAA